MRHGNVRRPRCFSVHVVKAQPAPQNTTVNVNYVYAASLGFGGYSIGGLSANVYTLPLSRDAHDLPVDGWPVDGWAIKLLLPIQLGLYDFHATVDGQRLSLSQQSLTLVPGAELQIPITDRFVVKPFAQAGPGHSFGTGSANPNAWVYLTGVRSVAQWQSGDYTFSLGNGVIYAGDNVIGPGFGEHYVALQVAGEVRRPVGFKIGDVVPDVGLFAAEYYYPAPLQFSRYLHNPLQISNQNEIGFSARLGRAFQASVVVQSAHRGRHRLRRRSDGLPHQFRLPVLTPRCGAQAVGGTPPYAGGVWTTGAAAARISDRSCDEGG